MSDATTDDDFVVEIDLGEMDWSAPALWEDSPEALSTAARKPEPEPPASKAEPATPEGDASTPEAEPSAFKSEPSSPEAKASALKAEPPAPRAEPLTLKAESRMSEDGPLNVSAFEPAPAAPSPAAAPEAAAPATTNTHSLPDPFAAVVGGVKSAAVRALVGSTFARLLRALETLSVIEKALTRPKAVRVGLLFEDVRAQSVSLLSQVTEAVSGGGLRLERRHREALDGMRFALGHELSKVFRQEFPGLAGDAGPAYTRADLSRAWGLLHNCLQQTAIALAQAFAPGATGESLFEDYKSRVENSFALYRELNVLLRKVTAAEGSSGILLKHSLVRHLEHFREETMRLLMYRDWGEFGRYADDVKRAFEEMEEFEPVLHEFSQYLRTLIHHVGMREALRGVSPQDYDHDDEEGEG